MVKIFNTNDYHNKPLLDSQTTTTTSTATGDVISGITAEELKDSIDDLYLSGQLSHTSPQTDAAINLLIDNKITPFKSESQINTLIDDRDYKVESEIQTIVDDSITNFKNTTEINTLIDSKIALIPTYVPVDDEDADLLEEDVANNVVSIGKTDNSSDIVEINAGKLKLGELDIAMNPSANNLIYSNEAYVTAQGMWNAHNNCIMTTGPRKLFIAKGYNCLLGVNVISRSDGGVYYVNNVRVGVNITGFESYYNIALGLDISANGYNKSSNCLFLGRQISVAGNHLTNTVVVGCQISPTLSNAVYIGNDLQTTYINKIMMNKEDGSGLDKLITDSEINTKIISTIENKLVNSDGDLFLEPINITNNVLLGKNIPTTGGSDIKNILVGNNITINPNKSYEYSGQELLDFINNNIRYNNNDEYSFFIDVNNEIGIKFNGVSNGSNPALQINMPIYTLGEANYNDVTVEFGTVNTYCWRSFMGSTEVSISSNTTASAYSYSSYLKDKNLLKFKIVNQNHIIMIKKITFKLRIDTAVSTLLTNTTAIGSDIIINSNDTINIGNTNQNSIIGSNLIMNHDKVIKCNKLTPTYNSNLLESHHPMTSINFNIDDVSFKQELKMDSDTVNINDKLVISTSDINVNTPILSTSDIDCVALECTEIIPKRIYLKTETIGSTIADFYIHFGAISGNEYRSIDGLIDRYTQNYIITSGSYNSSSSTDAYSYKAPYIAYEKYRGSIYSFTMDKKDNGFSNVYLRSNGTPIYTNTGAEINGGITLQYEREIKLRFIWDYVTSVGHFVLLTELLGTVATYSSVIAAAAAPSVGVSTILDTATYTGSSFIKSNEYNFMPDTRDNNMIIIDDAGLTAIILPTTGLIVGTTVKIIIDRTDAIVLKTKTGNRIYNYIYARSTDDVTGEITDGSVEIVMSGKHMSICSWSGTGWYINF